MTCPSGVPVSVGTRFTCHVVAKSGDDAVAESEVTSMTAICGYCRSPAPDSAKPVVVTGGVVCESCSVVIPQTLAGRPQFTDLVTNSVTS